MTISRSFMSAHRQKPALVLLCSQRSQCCSSYPFFCTEQWQGRKGGLRVVCGIADSATTDARVQDLEKRAKEAMQLPEEHGVHYTDLHDALTSMRFHGKQIPKVS